MNLSQEYLKECFDYNPETGVLLRKVRPREHFLSERSWKRYNNNYAGERAGYIHNPKNLGGSGIYRALKLDGKKYLEHRVIFMLVGGHCPDVIDHVNRDGTDNRWENLRKASHAENCFNTRYPNKSGLKGIGYVEREKAYGVTINYKKKAYSICYTKDIEEAKFIYNLVANSLYGDFHEKHETTYSGSNRFKDNKFFSVHLPKLLREKVLC